jgi:DNA ligase-associated metallophosphoesterase
MNDYFIEISNKKFKVLHKVLYWESQNALLLADLHLGKDLHFRKSGVPVPEEVANETLLKLEALILKFQPQKVFLLGDLFHHKNVKVVQSFNEFCDKFKNIDFTLILGNHDKWILGKTSFNTTKELLISNILLTHEPQGKENYHNICGHIHPAVKLSGKGKQQINLPCLWHKNSQTILPSFGTFTGNHIIQPQKEDLIFVFDHREMIMQIIEN